jgi:hypothetical protein
MVELTADDALLENAIADHARIAAVNLLTFDYCPGRQGPGYPPGVTRPLS